MVCCGRRTWPEKTCSCLLTLDRDLRGVGVDVGCAWGSDIDDGVVNVVEEGLEMDANGMPAVLDAGSGFSVDDLGARVDVVGAVGAAGPGVGIVVGISSSTLAAFFEDPGLG